MSVRETECAPVIALDIGNVCLTIDASAPLRFLGKKVTVKRVLSSSGLQELIEGVETGRLSTAEYVSLAAKILPGYPSEKLIREAWLSILGPEISGMSDWVRKAHDGGLSIVLFSDTSELHYEALLPRLSFAEFIDGAVLSYEVGSRKPDAGMYRRFEEQFCHGNVPALYLDDRAENILAAQSRGWTTYHFGNMAGANAALDDVLVNLAG